MTRLEALIALALAGLWVAKKFLEAVLTRLTERFAEWLLPPEKPVTYRLRPIAKVVRAIAKGSFAIARGAVLFARWSFWLLLAAGVFLILSPWVVPALYQRLRNHRTARRRYRRAVENGMDPLAPLKARIAAERLALGIEETQAAA
jgi:hypothetical protein